MGEIVDDHIRKPFAPITRKAKLYVPKKRGRPKGKATGREVYMIVNDTTILPGTVNEYQGICIGAFCRNDPAGEKPFNPEKAWDKLKKLGWRCAKFREVM